MKLVWFLPECIYNFWWLVWHVYHYGKGFYLIQKRIWGKMIQEHEGVASHPGDNGMMYYAQKIIEQINLDK